MQDEDVQDVSKALFGCWVFRRNVEGGGSLGIRRSSEAMGQRFDDLSDVVS